MGKLRSLVFILLILYFASSLYACSNKDSEYIEDKEHVEWQFSKKMARVVQDDGWVYTFDYLYSKDGQDSDTLIPFQFYGVNLRYRYNDAYTEVINVTENGKNVTKTVPAVIQLLGGANSQGIKNDMEKVADILGYENQDVTPEELLAINPDDVVFEELDKDLFFNLIHEALNSESHPEGDNVLPVYALMTEPEYLNDYKFQIGFVSDMGTVDVIYIDVLYRTGSEYNDYVQLSDMVDNGTASIEQKQAFNLIKSISDGIIRDNNLMYEHSTNKDTKIADIDFYRLYNFLCDIENGNYDKYLMYAQ